MLPHHILKNDIEGMNFEIDQNEKIEIKKINCDFEKENNKSDFLSSMIKKDTDFWTCDDDAHFEFTI